MEQDSTSKLMVALVDGSLLQGNVNLKVYSRMGRLSDGLNNAEDFLVLTNVEFLQPPEGFPETTPQPDTLFVNRMQIVWAAPLED